MTVDSTRLPLKLYRADQVRELDRIAIQEQGIAGFTLMRRAGRSAFDLLLAHFPAPEKITVFCGTGNNGGDGYVIATLAQQQGIAVEVIQVGDPVKIQGDALQARQLTLQDGVTVSPFSAAHTVNEGVIVDALLGTGLSGEVRSESAQAIEVINQSGLPVIAIDIPSGLCSDRGVVLGSAVLADLTISFIGMKQGLMTGEAAACCGELYFSDLSVPDDVYQGITPDADRLDIDVLTSLLPPRLPTAHKGHFGHVLLVGGDWGMAGAVAMASQAASRTGAGLISCATRPEHIPALIARCPEVMAHGVNSGQELALLLERASVVVVGPGLGQQPWAEQLLQRVCELDVPLVLDADALNLLSRGLVPAPYREQWILTPHPGEAARLLACSTAEIQQDRFAAARALQQRYGGAVILKGSGTLVCDAQFDTVGVCPYGNPGMASGGMGDVLSGVLGGLLAQGLSVGEAARLGVSLHACAADIAAADGIRGLLATDLLPPLRQLVNL